MNKIYKCLEHIEYHWVHTKDQKTLFRQINKKAVGNMLKEGASFMEVFQAMINGQLIKKYKRIFGQWNVMIEYYMNANVYRIKIVGDFYTNFGVVYDNNINSWRKWKDKESPFCPQLIGMDSNIGLTKRVLAWIYKTIDERILP